MPQATINGNIYKHECDICMIHAITDSNVKFSFMGDLRYWYNKEMGPKLHLMS